VIDSATYTANLRAKIMSLLGDSLGTYQIKVGRNVNVMSAIADLPDPKYGYNFPPAGTTINGLEVVIETLNTDDLQLYINNDYGTCYGSKITLKQWDVSLTTRDGTEKLKALPSVRKISPVMTANSNLGTIESRSLTLVDWD